MINLDNLNEDFEIGTPLQINVTDILEDENQPRFEFPEFEMNQLAKSIAESGVKTPISVHKDPNNLGKYIINHGHRRYRASILAGKETVPAFIDEVYSDYDQVMENKERLGHTPLEIALFIQKKIDQGEKKGVIAERLNEKPVYISNHLALIDMPECIKRAYENGCNSPKTIYELRTLHKKYPEKIEEWIFDKILACEDITRTSVKKIGDEIKMDIENLKRFEKILAKPLDNEGAIATTEDLETIEALEVAEQPQQGAIATTEDLETIEALEVAEQPQQEAIATIEDLETIEALEVVEQPQQEATATTEDLETIEALEVAEQPQQEATATTESLKIVVSYEGKEGHIVNKRPSAKNKVIIKIGNEELEVNCTLVELEYVE